MVQLINILALSVVSVIAYGLWVRRRTWFSSWERGITITLALNAAAILALLPDTTISRHLDTFTGHRHIGSCVACCLFILAAASFRYAVACRVAHDDAEDRRQAEKIGTAVTISLPLLVGAFWASSAPDNHYQPNIFDVPPDLWLTVFWIVAEGTCMWMLGDTIRLLLIARTDPRALRHTWMNRVNTLYIAGLVCGMIASAIRLATLLIPALQPVEHGALIWVFASLAGAFITCAAAQSWTCKQRWLQPPTGKTLKRSEA